MDDETTCRAKMKENATSSLRRKPPLSGNTSAIRLLASPVVIGLTVARLGCGVPGDSGESRRRSEPGRLPGPALLLLGGVPAEAAESSSNTATVVLPVELRRTPT